MKRASITIACVICMLLMVSLSITPISQQAIADVGKSSITPETAGMTLSLNYTDHEPIEIDGNDDFITQGWPGNGTEANPFRISGLSIYSEYASINISNVDASFAISNCWLYYDDRPNDVSPFGVVLYNATNGIIESCRFTNLTYGIFINSSADINIDINLFDLNQRGVYVERSASISVSNNTVLEGFAGNPGLTGIDLLNSTRCLVSQNTIYAFRRGIVLLISTRCLVSQNTIYAIDFGISLVDEDIGRGGDSNKITGNRIREAYLVGIESYYETNLTVTYNEVITSTIGIQLGGSLNMVYGNLLYNYYHIAALDSGDDNQWDDGNGIGNCWGLAEEDGPHEINGSAGSIDHYPILVDSIDINYPIISSPADVNLRRLEAEPEITWIVWSTPGTYEVFIDNVPSESGNWPGPGPFVLELDKSDSVNHTYTLVIYDADGMNSSDSCDTLLVPLPLSFMVQIAAAGTASIVIIGLVVVELRKKRRISTPHKGGPSAIPSS
ncbi:MAG: NosD domain-containing protein [Candidatus Thorarchaeota archaeon]